MGQSIKNGPSNICGRQPLKNFTWSILEYLDSNNSNPQESCQVAKTDETIKEINSLPAYPAGPERSQSYKFYLK